jgi:predicted N-acetyltransferase YhbS
MSASVANGVSIRPESEADREAVARVHRAAFGREEEAAIVARLHAEGDCHPEYYPRFGFVPASRLGITLPIDVPDEVFMALELRPGGAGPGGLFRYSAAFGLPVH